jgi:hypothetical protein
MASNIWDHWALDEAAIGLNPADGMGLRPATPWPLLPLPRPCPYKLIEKDAGGLKTGLLNQKNKN